MVKRQSARALQQTTQPKNKILFWDAKTLGTVHQQQEHAYVVNSHF